MKRDLNLNLHTNILFYRFIVQWYLYFFSIYTSSFLHFHFMMMFVHVFVILCTSLIWPCLLTTENKSFYQKYSTNIVWGSFPNRSRSIEPWGKISQLSLKKVFATIDSRILGASSKDQFSLNTLTTFVLLSNCLHYACKLFISLPYHLKIHQFKETALLE